MLQSVALKGEVCEWPVDAAIVAFVGQIFHPLTPQTQLLPWFVVVGI